MGDRFVRTLPLPLKCQCSVADDLHESHYIWHYRTNLLETPVILAKTSRKIGNNNFIDIHSCDRHQIGSTESARGKIAKIAPTISVPVVRGQRFDRKQLLL